MFNIFLVTDRVTCMYICKATLLVIPTLAYQYMHYIDKFFFSEEFLLISVLQYLFYVSYLCLLSRVFSLMSPVSRQRLLSRP